MLNREDILAKTDLKKETVTIEEWQGDVLVSEMSGTQRDLWEQSLRQKDKAGNLISPRAKLVAFTVVDEKGDRLFTEDDISAIGKLSSGSLEKVCAIAMNLNGLGSDAVDNAKKN